MHIIELATTLLAILAFICLVTGLLSIPWTIDRQGNKGHKQVRPNDYRILYPAERPASKTPPTANDSGDYYVISLGNKLWLDETGYNSSMDFVMSKLLSKEKAYLVAADVGGKVHLLDMEIGGHGSGKHQFSVVRLGDKMYTMHSIKDNFSKKDTLSEDELTSHLNHCARYESADDAYVDAGKIGGTVLTFTLHEDQQWKDF